MGDLSIQNLVVEYYSGGYALRPINGLNLDVAAGSLVMLLGPSGCGKTTLLSCLGGILRPKSGAIKFDEVDITTLQGAELANYRRNKVGIVFQAFNLVPSLTAVENVMVPLRSAGMSRRASRRRAEELLARVNLAERMNHRPGDLSGGQQQRVAVARAIALDPPLILADEPTAHLDFIQVCQEFGGHDGADGVPTEVLGSGRTAAVTIEAGKRIGATLFQGAAQHIAIGHGPKCLSCASHAVGPIS